jgi:cyclase
MLRPRIIPVLLLHRGALYKTRGFAEPVYVGDPINAVRIFNEKEVDELMVVDIDATREGREPNFAMIADLAAECRMPMCYGGGVSTLEQIERITALGVEKIAMNAAALASPELITKASESVGSQSVVAVLDVRREGLDWAVYSHNGTRATGMMIRDAARLVVDAGVGEVVVNSIDRDGKMEGYDLNLVQHIVDEISVPLTVLGGAGKREHLQELFRTAGIIGAAAGSMFVFKGSLRAVLINYPKPNQKEQLFCKENMRPF